MIEWVKKSVLAFWSWGVSITHINKRLKALELMHGSGIHPADICPECGNHTLRQKTESVHETVFAHRYEHIQNTILFCTNPNCNFTKVIESKSVQTNTPQTNNIKPRGMKIKFDH